MTEQCGNCRYWQKSHEVVRRAFGPMFSWCRRFPPAVIEPSAEFMSDRFAQPVVNESDWCGEYRPAGPLVANPKHSGVGTMCAPADQQHRKYMLNFDDDDKGVALYDDEALAREAFARAESMGWNCYLWTLVPR